jgi:di/tricarboxylate transporter
MTLAAGFTLFVILMALVLMMANLAQPDVALLGGVVLLTVAGILSPAQAASGFGNTGMLTVGALFVVAAGLRDTGAVDAVTHRLLGRPRSERLAILRLTAPTVLASAFLNNTTIVATLMPAVAQWSRRTGIPASRLLMPLSFAAILGGTCTLIGTSTNLIVSGMVAELAPGLDGLEPFGLFDITPVGLAVAGVGVLLLVALGPLLLPDRRAAVSTADDPREYVLEMLVPVGSPLDDQTIESIGLQHMPGAYLMELVREGRVNAVVDPTRRLRVGDRLVFVAGVEAVLDLQRSPGLVVAPDQVFKLEGQRHERQIVEAVVSDRNPLIGQSIRGGGFRNRYQAVVIAVARSGERLLGRIGDIVLHQGDVLLLEAHPSFMGEQRTRTDFYLVSQIEGANPRRTDRAAVALAILAALILSVSLDLVDTSTAAFCAALMVVLTRCCTLEAARRSIDLQVLVAIASSIGLGRAMQETGLDTMIAGLAIDAGADNPFAALVVVYLFTTLLTEVVTNNAAAVLMVPIGLSLAAQLDASPMGYMVAVMFAASASFLSPIGYQTNLMVFGPGGYKPLDYPRLGLPLAIAVGLTTLFLIPTFWPF